MNRVDAAFSDRKTEVESYLLFVETIERCLQSGQTTIRIGDEEIKVTPLQQRILYAGIYLHLYNLVESTVTLLIEAIESAAMASGDISGGDLSLIMRKQWIKATACTHQLLEPENRLKKAMEVCDQLLGLMPFTMNIPRKAGGNWDDVEIEKLAERLGIALSISQDVKESVKRPARDNKGPLRLIRDFRNKLAHGSISFSECGNDHVASDLRSIADVTLRYMSIVIEAFRQYILTSEFLDPSVRTPQGAEVSTVQ